MTTPWQPGTEAAWAIALTGLGRALQVSDRPGEAIEPLRRATALWEGGLPLGPGARLDLARDHALMASEAADLRSGLTAAQGAAAGGRAMAALRRAVADGCRDRAGLLTDSDFDTLRARDDFRELMRDMTRPADPFARVR